jgi:DNA-binding SARP family transcriptional activator/Tfp pilus assembly protein PilF
MAVDFRLLGTTGAWLDGRAVDLGHGRQQCVLVALLVEANQVVSPDQLLDRVWGDDAPQRGRDTLYSYLSRLRQAFGGTDEVTIGRQSGGYVLTVDPAAVDLHRFGGLLAEARAAQDDARRLALFERALGQWRASAFTGLDTPWINSVRDGLEKERFAVELDCVDLRLRQGQHAELVTELAARTAKHPLDERVAGQHMLALYRCGRQAEALDAYQDLRERLADALGVDPWPELQRLHTAILRQDPELTPSRETPAVATPVPAQLPPAVNHFTGRHAYLESLDALLPDHGTSAPVVISAVAGTGGVGKTALAVHWAHRVLDRFPDGQLYVNLRGYDVAEPIGPGAALEGFLRALGFDPAAIPSTVDERAALYRSALSGRRVLVLLDNARSTDQVRPLLPGGPGCLVLVTSRDDLAGLVVRDGAHRLTLERLTEGEAVELLNRVLGVDLVAAEPRAAVDLARLCAGLPLALRVAAERIARRRGTSLTALTAELDDLEALDVPEDPASAVRVVFSWSYLALPRDAARLFRLLGLHPGPDHGAHAAAALAAVDLTTARRLLDVLTSAHLVERTGPDRYQAHDLLRLYAKQVAEAEEDHDARAAALRGVSTWYLATAYRAADLLYPAMLHLPRLDVATTGPDLDDPAQALAWLETERRNLVAVIGGLAATEDRRLAWRLADALRGYFWLRKHHDDWQEVVAHGLDAARFDQHAEGQAAMHLSLATAQLSLSRYEPAVEHFRRAQEFSARAGWVEAEAAALGNLGIIHRHRGELTEAAEHHARALTLVRRIGARVREAEVLGNLGNVHFELGQLKLAAAHCEQALAIHEETGSRYGEAIDLGLLGVICLELGEFDQATAHLERALAIHRGMGARETESAVLTTLAKIHCETGDDTAARNHAEEALRLADETESRGTEVDAHVVLGTVDRRLGQLGHALEHHRHALDIAGQDGYRRGEVEALTELSATHLALGQVPEAVDSASRAVRIAGDAGYRVPQGRALTALAEARLAEGAVSAAAVCCEEALALQVDTGDRGGEARTLAVLARVEAGLRRSSEDPTCRG